MIRRNAERAVRSEVRAGANGERDHWHEAAIIYLAATLAGMIVNPILPSLRERELLFILNDARSRLIFVQSTFRQHNYIAMMSRVTAQLD